MKRTSLSENLDMSIVANKYVSLKILTQLQTV